MNDDHATTVDRLRLFETTRRANAMDRLDDAQQKDAAARGTFVAGSRVLDLVTGREGTVTRLPSPSATASRLVSVRMDSGVDVIRRPDQLYPRPTPPTA
jgi:hypothetical protein